MSFLETDFTVDLLREQCQRVVGPARRKLQQLGDTPVRLSLFVVCELEAGAALSHSLAEQVRRLCQECEVVYSDERFAPLYAETLASLKQQGFTIATMDILVAIQALALNDTLITRNVRPFQKIPHLRLEDY